MWKDFFITILCFMAIRSLHFDVTAVKLKNVMKCGKYYQSSIKACLDRQFTGNLGMRKSMENMLPFLLIWFNFSKLDCICNTMKPCLLLYCLFAVSHKTNTNLKNSWVHFIPDELWKSAVLSYRWYFWVFITWISLFENDTQISPILPKFCLR